MQVTEVKGGWRSWFHHRVFLPGHYPSASDPAREQESAFLLAVFQSPLCLEARGLPVMLFMTSSDVFTWKNQLGLGQWGEEILSYKKTVISDRRMSEELHWIMKGSHKSLGHIRVCCHSKEDVPAVVVQSQSFAISVIRQKPDRTLHVSALPLANPLSEL